MRHCLLSIVLLAAATPCHAGLINVPAEAGSPVKEDDWSIPLHRCIRSPYSGVGVYDGAERCAIEFAFPQEAGRRLVRVRALYQDSGLSSQFSMQILSRDLVGGTNVSLAFGSDHALGLTPLESMTLAPNHLLPPHGAAFVLVEVRGDTVLKGITFDYL